MGFYDRARQRVRMQKNSEARTRDVSDTSKTGYTRKVDQRYDPKKRSTSSTTTSAGSRPANSGDI